MMEEEDVLQNPFFKAVKGHPTLYPLIQKNCYTLLVPSAPTISGVTLNDNFLQLHILQPSPYFQNHFTTLNKKTVEIEDKHIYTREGFDEVREIRILAEETFYNSNSTSFRVLTIQRPLEGGAAVLDTKVLHSLSPLPKDRTPEACIMYLQSFPENVIVIQNIDEHLREFNKSYIIIKHYETHAARKVLELYTYSLEALICANPIFREFHNTGKFLNEFKEIVEVYVLHRLHRKVWEGLTATFKHEDEELFTLSCSLHNIRQSDLGIRAEVQCPMAEASRKLRQMDNYTTPIGKLLCLKETSDMIIASVSKHVTQGSDVSVTTDDVIPFLAYIVILCQPKHLKTNLFYMEHLTAVNLSTNQIGFNLVSLQAAVQYLKSEEIRKLSNAESQRKFQSAEVASRRSVDPSQPFDVSSLFSTPPPLSLSSNSITTRTSAPISLALKYSSSPDSNGDPFLPVPAEMDPLSQPAILDAYPSPYSPLSDDPPASSTSASTAASTMTSASSSAVPTRSTGSTQKTYRISDHIPPEQDKLQTTSFAFGNSSTLPVGSPSSSSGSGVGAGLSSLASSISPFKRRQKMNGRTLSLPPTARMESRPPPSAFITPNPSASSTSASSSSRRKQSGSVSSTSVSFIASVPQASTGPASSSTARSVTSPRRTTSSSSLPKDSAVTKPPSSSSSSSSSHRNSRGTSSPAPVGTAKRPTPASSSASAGPASSSSSSFRFFAKPPEVISVEKPKAGAAAPDEGLGEFLSKLRDQKNDTSTRLFT